MQESKVFNSSELGSEAAKAFGYVRLEDAIKQHWMATVKRRTL